jgi:hypothetical protein
MMSYFVSYGDHKAVEYIGHFTLAYDRMVIERGILCFDSRLVAVLPVLQVDLNDVSASVSSAAEVLVDDPGYLDRLIDVGLGDAQLVFFFLQEVHAFTHCLLDEYLVLFFTHGLSSGLV